MQIVIAAGRLREGVTEEQLIAGSDAFDAGFVRNHPGVLRREIVKADNGVYADVVLFRDAASLEQVLEAEQTSAVCAEFFSLFSGEDESMVTYEVLKQYPT